MPILVVKLLIIRLSSIGDIVLTTPLVRCLKKQLEHAEVHFLTKKQYEPVVKYNPYIDKVWLYHQNLHELMDELKKEEFHYVFDLHHNLRTLRIKNHLRALSFSFNKLNIEKWLIVNFNINRLPDKHIVDRYLETSAIFGVKNDNFGLDYFTGPDDEILPDGIMSLLPEKFLAMCIGAQHFTKKAPAEKLAGICDHSPLPVILLGGKDDEEEAVNIVSHSIKKNVTNLAGKLSLNQSAILVRKSQAVVTHDTGLMHIAAAYKKIIFSLWGNTIPEFGMYPYQPGEGSTIFEVKGLACRPCSKIGFRKCPRKHFKCMNELNAEEIGRKIRETLKFNEL